MTVRKPVRFYFGHHRCASSWITDIFRAVAQEVSLRHVVVHNARLFDHDLAAYSRRRDVECVAYVNADYQHVKDLTGIRAFHVVRDPRDVVVSAYFSHLHSHATEDWPELHEHRARLQSLDRNEGLVAEMENLEWEFACMEAWRYDRPDILEMRMEDLVADPYQGMVRIVHFLELLDETRFTLARRALYPAFKGLRILEARLGGRVAVPLGPSRLPAERLLGIVWENDFASKTNGRQPGREDPTNHYRMGTAGDWRNHFSTRHIEYFKARHGDLLVKLGYERDHDWH